MHGRSRPFYKHNDKQIFIDAKDKCHGDTQGVLVEWAEISRKWQYIITQVGLRPESFSQKWFWSMLCHSKPFRNEPKLLEKYCWVDELIPECETAIAWWKVQAPQAVLRGCGLPVLLL